MGLTNLDFMMLVMAMMMMVMMMIGSSSSSIITRQFLWSMNILINVTDRYRGQSSQSNGSNYNRVGVGSVS